MVTVIESWYLKDGLEHRALELMQAMDDIVEPGAHLNPGWRAHATFLQNSDNPCKVLMIYPWRDRESHRQLAAEEQPILQSFFQEYCAKPREIAYYVELPVKHKD